MKILKTYKKSEIEGIEKEGIVIISIAGLDNKDADGDIIRKGAFNKSILERMKKIYHLVDHQWSFQKMIGTPLKIYEQENKLIAQSKLNLNTQLGRDMYEQYKFFADNGRSFEHSVGFAVPEGKQGFDEELKANIIKEVKLFEYSTVLLGANPNTEIIDIKSLEKLFNYDFSFLTELEQRIKALEEQPLISTVEDEPHNYTTQFLKQLLNKL